MTTGEHAGGFDPSQQAMDVMLGEPRTGLGVMGNEIRRPLLLDQDLATKVMAQAEGDALRAAEILRDTLVNLPAEKEAWDASRATGFLFGDPRVEGTYAIFGALGTSAQLASEFRNLTEQSTALDAITPHVAGVSTIRSWNAGGSNPEAGVIVAELLADKLSPEAFGSILAQRYYSAGRAGGGNVEALANYGTMVQLLAQSSVLPDSLREQAHVQYEKVQNTIAAAQERQYRTNLIAHAKEAADSFMDESTFMALAGPEGTLAEIARFNPDLAAAFEITANARFLTNNHTSELAPDVLRRQETLIGLLVKAVQEDTTLQLPSELNAAVSKEVMRRAQGIATSDDARYAELLDLANQLKINGLAYKIETQQMRQAADERRARERREIMDVLGFESLDLPDRLGSIRVQVPQAHIEYDNIEDLIADIERYFVDRKTQSETGRDVDQAVDSPHAAALSMSAWGPQSTNRIFTTMRDEMHAWAKIPARRKQAKQPFSHSEDDGDGTPYKYEGSSFTGNRISVTETDDGKYHLSILSGGHSYNSYDPCYNLVPFAEALGKRIDYEEVPSLEITIEPNESELHRYAGMQTADFEPTVNGSLMYHDSLPVPIRDLIDFYRQVIGLPNSGKRLDEIFSDHADEINDLIGADEHAYHQQVGIRLEDSTVVLAIDRGTRVDRQGNLLTPVTVFEKDGDDEGRSLYRPSLRIGLKTDVDQTTLNEMVRRTLLYQRNVKDRRWEGEPLPAGWTRTSYDGLQLKQVAK